MRNLRQGWGFGGCNSSFRHFVEEEEKAISFAVELIQQERAANQSDIKKAALGLGYDLS
jgi:hypothetical protein